MGDHSKIAAGALLERIEAGLQITDLRSELPIALGELRVFRLLRGHGPVQARDLTHAIVG